MLVSITSTTPDAGDLGFLLHKHPNRVRSVDVAGGRAHVFYPEATPERTTATLLVEVDPVRLSRPVGSKKSKSGPAPANLEPYVNDRPYVASSMLCVAIGRLFGTALAGRCDTRPDLVDTPLDLELAVPVVAARGGVDAVKRLFEPLGWSVEAEVLPLDPAFESWGDSRYVSLVLKGAQTVKDALAHLFVLLPVLDDAKHYWVGESEVDKLLRRGGAWLPKHPDREFIARRYLRFASLSRDALARLAEGDADIDGQDDRHNAGEEEIERPISLNQQRLTAVTEAVLAAGGGRVVDLGCGEGRLLERLIAEPQVMELMGVDVSLWSLDKAERRLRLENMSERRREKIRLVQGALTYTDARIRGADVATIVEVIEHLDAERLDVFARVVFGDAAPSTVIVTTPNREYNVNFEGLEPGRLRHGDHRFEWTRAEFAAWVESVNQEFGYTAEFFGIGPEHPETGPPTQMSIFRRGVAYEPSNPGAGS